MKVMLLCAGRGERMHPLTLTTPKPLLYLNGEPIVVHTLKALKAAGFRDIVLNVSFLGEKIIQALGDGATWGLNIQYSIEDTPLETAGGIIKALPLLGEGPIVVISGDIYTEYDFQSLLQRSWEGVAAHCVMVPNPSFHPEGDFHMDADHRLHNEGQPRLTHGNIGVYQHALFEHRPQGRLGLGKILYEIVPTQRVTGELYTGVWHNVGTPEELMRVNQALTEKTA